MEKYMDALSKFKKGDVTTVKYRRGNEVLEAPVQF
jgi:aminopeptidase YwaD